MNVLLFDYDGTLVSSLEAVKDALNAIALKYGVQPVTSTEAFRELYDKNVYDSIVERGLPRDKLPAFFNDWRKPFLKPNAQVSLIPGIKEVLHELAKKHHLAIITSNSREAIEVSIAHFKLEGIQEILGGDKQISKVEKIASVKKRFPQAEVYYIGDTKGDVLEGKKAGVKTVAVTWGVHSRKHLEEAEPTYLIDTPEELLAILG